MKVLLDNYYDIHVQEEEVTIDGNLGYLDHEYVYFIITVNNNKVINMEQAILAYYLVGNGVEQIASPIPNIKGEWITEVDEKEYMVVKVKYLHSNISSSHGIALATFHLQSMSYAYEPEHISSYGLWKQLWIEKLTFFENYIAEQAKQHSNRYFRLLMDVMPYMIGLSENAIQYMRESELEQNYDERDQGVITFHRYDDQLLKQVIWPKDLVYDHKTRDISEYIRKQLLQQKEVEDIIAFLDDYESILPLTTFGWRLLYARLLYPIHLFDFIGIIFEQKKYKGTDKSFEDLLSNHLIYERKLKEIFRIKLSGNSVIQIPVLDWMK